MSRQITAITARQILDSRGYPTVECDVTLMGGYMGRAAVPSGASTGSHEAVELRDNDESQFQGKGVGKAISNINSKINKTLQNKAFSQQELDHTLIDLDGTKNKSNLGANAILAVSLAFAKAMASTNEQPLYLYIASLADTKVISLPTPMINVINGGAHAKGTADIQEFMLVPMTSKSYGQALRQSAEVFYKLKQLIGATLVGDEGGFAPKLDGNEQALKLLNDAVEQAGYEPEKDFSLAVDVAASELYADGHYRLQLEDQSLNRQQMIAWLSELAEKFPLVSIEDGLDENDWDGWAELNQRLGKSTQLVGDDLLVTNISYLKKAIAEQSCNAILIKPNQIGTLSETIDAVQMAQQANFNTVISHRSGETEDTTIAHLAVGLNAGQIKTGSLSRGERTAKYNELLRIEEQLGKEANYRGGRVFK